MSLSIVIPAYNEEKRIINSIGEIIRFCEKTNISKSTYEIIIVDDGSTDNTLGVIDDNFRNEVRIIKNCKNFGKGYSVRQGILKAKHDLVLFSDADLSTPIEEVERMMGIIKEGYDIVIASRNIQGSKIIVKQPFNRRFLGKVFQLIIRKSLLPDIRDTQCGFKLFRKEIAKEISKYQSINRYSFDVEMLCIAKRKGFRVVETPVKWIDRRGSKVNPLRDGFLMLKELGIIMIKDKLKMYGKV